MQLSACIGLIAGGLGMLATYAVAKMSLPCLRVWYATPTARDHVISYVHAYFTRLRPWHLLYLKNNIIEQVNSWLVMSFVFIATNDLGLPLPLRLFNHFVLPWQLVMTIEQNTICLYEAMSNVAHSTSICIHFCMTVLITGNQKSPVTC